MPAACGTHRGRSAARGLVCLATAATLSCATGGAPRPTSTPAPISTLTYEQDTLRIPIRIDPSGTVSFAEKPPLAGRIDLAPIVKAEGLAGKPVAAQAMLHYGRLYVVADEFRSLWEITPRPGSSVAGYRSIPVPHVGAGRLKEARLSRYGSPGSSCVRLDHAGGVLFITPDGDSRDACP
ncbi:MAG TPA: hypothetical protein VGS03_18790 [Candidatus Polarisedimenticolia bacterium]|nr:hypothetical protein [Candidatus Polarisedimenticolia bacterium]